MSVDVLVVGDLNTNCYIVTKDDKTIIIDPGALGDKIIDHCKDKNIVGIFITHYHFDHIGALDSIKKEYNVLVNPLKIDGLDYEIIKTPGHKNDSITIYFKEENMMFVGDFIFYHSIGRMDLDGGSINDMKDSLKMISNYPDDTIIYPGHGISTTLGEEKKYFSMYF